jgi:hypothetical protein
MQNDLAIAQKMLEDALLIWDKLGFKVSVSIEPKEQYVSTARETVAADGSTGAARTAAAA